MLNETHAARSDMLIRDIIARMRHDGCGGRAGKVELLTGIEGASSRPVRRIVLIGELIVAVAFRLSSSTIVQLAGRHPLFPNLVPELPGLYAQVGDAVVANGPQTCDLSPPMLRQNYALGLKETAGHNPAGVVYGGSATAIRPNL